ncbi:MAG: DNA gyrase inhibitor YacG [Acidobacteriota bacterium]|nr:DNA gyrase inhibitor YacG [Acidobacteriota bacterium]
MKKCPICAKPVETKENPHLPFCSELCKLLDLGNWVDENYRVPSQEERPSVEELEGQVQHDGAKP